MTPHNYRPEFATNAPEKGETVAGAINTLLGGLRTRLVQPPDLAIATAYFNPGGFSLLAEELEQVGHVRLLLGAEPAQEQPQVRPLSRGAKKRRRRGSGPTPEVRRALEGHQRSLHQDRDLVGFTRETDARERRLVAWLREHPGVQVRRYEQGFLHGKAFLVETDTTGVIAGSSNFTYAGLARNNELNLGHYQPHVVGQVLDWFDRQWEAAVPYDLAALYEARWQPHQPWHVFLRMLHELYGADLEEDTQGDSRLGLTRFQADGVWRAKRILHRRRGVLIADEVGLGKTFLAGELIHEAVFERRQKVLIIAPATLRDATWRPFLREHNLAAVECVSFEELVAHIEDAGSHNSALQDPDQYAMVVVDEAHALRNDSTKRAAAVRRLLAGSVAKDLVELTATPVNNSLDDLHNLISYFATNDAEFADVGIPSLRAYFNRASALHPDDLSPEHLFDVLDEVAVRRTRRFVKNHYVGDKVVINGREREISFPTCRVQRIDYNLDKLLPGIFDELATALGADTHQDTDTVDGTATGVILERLGAVLTMARYVPSRFKKTGAAEQYEAQNAGLLRSNLLKRFESSAQAFEKTVGKMVESHALFLEALESGMVLTGKALGDWGDFAGEDIEEFLDSVDSQENVSSADGYDVERLREAVEADLALLQQFRTKVQAVDFHNDPKVAKLIEQLATIAREAEEEGIGEDDVRNKRKVLIFTYFSDTADYLDRALKHAITVNERLAAYRDRLVLVKGSDKANRSEAITGFAPMTAGTGTEEDRYDVIVATDTLAEGVNLQQARHIINYDLPWNPMRLVQRHGRIDRIGSPHTEVFMRCFFPDEGLDAVLRLEERLQRKLKQAAASIGQDTVLPNVAAVERVITDTRDQIERLRREESLLFADAGNSSLSGEEYRRQLANEFQNPHVKDTVLGLPWGSGSGFHRPGADPGFVFCARIGDHSKPWLRYVPMNRDLTVQVNPGEETAVVIDDVLSCLAQATPPSATAEPVLDERTYQAAFNAWEAAQEDILTQWKRQTDPLNLSPQVPKAMRDASALVKAHGSFLEKQEELAQRLNAPYAPRIQREIRSILADQHTTDKEKARALHTFAESNGLTPPPRVQPLPPAEKEDIHLVCWIAITPSE
ncbi:helicase-related protein [Nocardiopsis sp. FR4]|uniref:helicase-related protein n=1 Tax=Nocardiopsis sp. FR4 TaxID=2605985 RepID=UPI0019150AB2|nr:helicase-related protein [Nocardiopsis sp. FR4]